MGSWEEAAALWHRPNVLGVYPGTSEAGEEVAQVERFQVLRQTSRREFEHGALEEGGGKPRLRCHRSGCRDHTRAGCCGIKGLREGA